MFHHHKPYRIGLALSGGGARGFAHAVAIKAINEFGIYPNIIAGVSAGSVVSVFYAAGIDPEDMVEAFAEQRFTDLCKWNVPKTGFFSLERFADLVVNTARYTLIDDLPIPTVICATDMDHGIPVAFESGAIGPRVAASCSIPIIFDPVTIDGVRYLDGGLLHNLPAWAIRDRCDILIGLNCSSVRKRPYRNSLLDIAHASYNITIKSNVKEDLELCDIAVDMQEISDYKTFNIRDIRTVFQQGYEITRRKLIEVGLPEPPQT